MSFFQKSRVKISLEAQSSLLVSYIEARKSTGEILIRDRAMFISFSPNVVNKPENRLTINSMQRIVNGNLKALALKHSENRTVSTHGLRHTAAYQLQLLGCPLRQIHEALGHADPRTTAIYAHIESLWKNNPFSKISIAI